MRRKTYREQRPDDRQDDDGGYGDHNAGFGTSVRPLP